MEIFDLTHESSQQSIPDVMKYNPLPIIKLDIKKNILQYNAAAQISFPDLHSLQLTHPLLHHLVETIGPLLKKKEVSTFEREIIFLDSPYLQNIYITPHNQTAIIYISKKENNKILELENKIALLKNCYRQMNKTKKSIEYSLKCAETGLWSCDFYHDLLLCDETALSLLEINPTTFVLTLKNVMDLIFPEDKPAFLDAFKTGFHLKTPFSIHFRLLNKENTLVPLMLKGQRCLDDIASHTKMFGILLRQNTHAVTLD